MVYIFKNIKEAQESIMCILVIVLVYICFLNTSVKEETIKEKSGFEYIGIFFKNEDISSKLNKSGKLRTFNKNNFRKYCHLYKIRRLVTIHFKSYKSVIELF